MKKSLVILASFGALAAALAGCSASQITAAGNNVAAVNAAGVGALKTVAGSIVAACPAGQAFLTSAAAATANPDVSIAKDANGLFCAVNTAIATGGASAPVAASAAQ